MIQPGTITNGSNCTFLLYEERLLVGFISSAHIYDIIGKVWVNESLVKFNARFHRDRISNCIQNSTSLFNLTPFKLHSVLNCNKLLPSVIWCSVWLRFLLAKGLISVLQVLIVSRLSRHILWTFSNWTLSEANPGSS